MNNNFSILNNNIYKKYLNKNKSNKLKKKFEKAFGAVKKDIKNSKKTLNVLNKDLHYDFKIKDLKRFKKYKDIAVIGMGGSILGSEAIYDFLKKKIKKNIFFFNDLNEENIISFKKKKISKVLFIIISKSGNTIETLSNAFSLNILKKNAKNIIIISERKNNFLFKICKNLNLFYIEHKKFIGGRYSVLSEVGLVPAYLMGVNIKRLRAQILDCFKQKNKNFLKQNTIMLANLMKSKKFNNLIFLNYIPECEKFLYWCQQLIAESLGKRKLGFLPVISNVPKDHHSLLQLYLDGPKDKFFNIFCFETKNKVKININKSINLKSFLNKKKLNTVKKAQKNALIKAFNKKNIPFRELKLRKNNEEVLGKLFSYFIVETIIVGKLLNINPFDQPAVEQVKDFTKKFLT